MTPPMKYRLAESADLALIFSSWLKSFRDSPFAREIQTTIYFKEQHQRVSHLIEEATTLLAVNPEDPAQIYGWVCFQLKGGVPVMHYIYVKHPYRGLGIARGLFQQIDPGGPFIYTHLIEKRGVLELRGVYNPYLAEAREA